MAYLNHGTVFKASAISMQPVSTHPLGMGLKHAVQRHQQYRCKHASHVIVAKGHSDAIEIQNEIFNFYTGISHKRKSMSGSLACTPTRAINWFTLGGDRERQLSTQPPPQLLLRDNVIGVPEWATYLSL